MKNAKRWYIFWNVVRAASMVIILINAFILYRSGESIVVALAGEQQGAIFWVLQFTANCWKFGTNPVIMNFVILLALRGRTRRQLIHGSGTEAALYPGS